MREEVLTDELWARLEPLIPVHPRRFPLPGRKCADDRTALEDILYVVRTVSAAHRPVRRCGRHLLATVDLAPSTT